MKHTLHIDPATGLPILPRAGTPVRREIRHQLGNLRDFRDWAARRPELGTPRVLIELTEERLRDLWKIRHQR